MTVPIIPLCPRPQETPRCISRAEAVVTADGATTRHELPFDPNQGYLVRFEPANAGELRYYIELTLRDGGVQRLPHSAPTDQFSVPVSDGGYDVALPGSAAATKASESRRLEWGSGAAEVGKFDGREGDDGGPAGFGVMSDGTVVVGDYINSRLSVIDTTGAVRSTELTPDERGTFVKDDAADTGLVLGQRLSTVSATGRPAGATSSSTARIASTPPGDAALADGRLWLRDETSRWMPVNHDGRLGKAVDGDAPPTVAAASKAMGDAVTVEVRNGPVEISIADADGSTTHWTLAVPGGAGGVLSTDLTDSGDVVAAIATIEPDADTGHAWVARLTTDGRYGTSYIEAPWHYMVNGPQFQVDETTFHVMAGDRHNLRVDSYPIPAATMRAS